VKKINEKLLDEVTIQAQKDPRKRMNYNFHQTASDPLQRMLNALEPGTYIAPHCHKDNIEVFILLKGAITVLLFNDKGSVTDTICLDPLQGKYGVEIPSGVWHSIYVEEAGSVIYEFKEGPYNPITAGVFADWAPSPELRKEGLLYLKSLLD